MAPDKQGPADFFDAIDVSQLIANAIRTEFPLPDLIIAMLYHVAPRVIQCAKACSQPISVFKSIE